MSALEVRYLSAETGRPDTKNSLEKQNGKTANRTSTAGQLSVSKGPLSKTNRRSRKPHQCGGPAGRSVWRMRTASHSQLRTTVMLCRRHHETSGQANAELQPGYNHWSQKVLPKQNGKTANRTSAAGPLPKRTQRQRRDDGFAIAPYLPEARLK